MQAVKMYHFYVKKTVCNLAEFSQIHGYSLEPLPHCPSNVDLGEDKMHGIHL